MKRYLAYFIFLFAGLSGQISSQTISSQKGLTTTVFTAQVNRPNISTSGGLEVNSYTGGLFYKRNDLYIPGRGLSLDFTFYYNSFNTELDFGYGRGWSMTYSVLCIPDSNKVIIRHADGRKDVFTQNGSDYAPQTGIFDSLVKYDAGKFWLRNKTGTKYFFDDSTHHRLTSIVDRNGNSIIISYTDSLPTTITDASGRIVQLQYISGHLTDITDPNTSPARHITLTYDGTGSPVSVTDPLGNTILYEYDPVQNLTKLTDQLSFPYIVAYNDCIHVSSVTSPLNSFSFSYDTVQHVTSSSLMVNSVLQTTTYKFDTLGNIIEKNGACCGYHQLYEYDSLKNLIKKTDANGSIWNYNYDTKGNMIQETDPLNNIRTITYEPVYSRISSITDKRGNTTTYNYDANGNLILIQHPLGITQSFSYSLLGLLQTYVDGRGNATTYTYNIHGDKLGEVYANGTSNHWTYDNVGNPTSSTDANSFTTNYLYDLLNRLMQTTNVLGHTNSISYDTRSSIITKTDALGRVTTTIYDALGRKTSNTTPKGTTLVVYDEAGNPITVTDPRGNVTHYTYNLQNLVSVETNALGHSRNFGYDANGNRTTESDFSGQVTLHYYDDLNRLTQITDALSNSTFYSYDANNNRVSSTDANGHITTSSFDALNRLTQEQRPIGSTSFSYDANGNRTSMINPNGNTTTYVYDVVNRRITVTDPLGNSINQTYDANGNKLTETDRNGLITTLTYDAINRLLTQTNAALETKSFTYDAVGNKITQTFPNGNVQSFTYDTGNRMTSISDMTGNGGTFTYNAVDNILTQTNGTGKTVTYTYDVLNRRSTAQDAMGDITTFVYDNNSNLISSTDRNGNTTTISYDQIDRKISTTQPTGKVTTHGYDAIGNVTSLTDDKGNVTTYLFDSNDRVISETYANGSVKTITYDALGNRITHTNNNGLTTIINYDAANRLISRNYPGGGDSFSYDAGGRVTGAVNANANINISYDNANRVLSENMNGKITSYIYNVAALKTFITYPGGRVIEEDYDLRNRLSAVKESSVSICTFSYDASNNVLSRNFLNGANTSYSYNNNDWITNINHTKNAISFAEFNYTFDSEGNLLSSEKLHRPANSEKYDYDQDYRTDEYKEGALVSGNIPAPVTQTAFNYDGAGNRTTMVRDAVTTIYNSNNVNQYVAIADPVLTSPNYDPNGNMVYDGTFNYQYSIDNRIVAVNGGSVALYKHDPFGRRIQKITAAGTINYYYDAQRVIEERNASNAVTNTYVYGSKLDEILSMRRLGNNFFYHQNSLGSIIAVTNSSGQVVERYEYDAFGSVIFYSPAFVQIPATTIGNRILFTSREYDSETKTYHYRARDYIPRFGKFMQRDPLEYIDGVNVYEYCLSNPINKTDPLGLYVCPPLVFGCTKIHEDGTLIDVDDIPLGTISIFVIRGSLWVEWIYDANECFKCCPDCSIKPYGDKSISLLGEAIVTATASYYIFTLQFYGHLIVSGKGSIKYDECFAKEDELCIELTGTIKIGVRASATLIIITVYAGAEGTGSCTLKVCFGDGSFDYSDLSCSLSGRIFVGYKSWWGDKEWDIVKASTK